ncbi:MAG: BspA family leucine-rich repeat surface protein, partial [Prevotella sp.]|nr:BspA family leucine-rich repeat surface protein [Prevotella sp.]
SQYAIIGIQPASNGRLYIVDGAGGKATLYYDMEASNKGDKARPLGYEIGEEVTEVELHPSFANCKPKRLSFSGCNNLKEIKGIKYLNTEEMTNMQSMFSGCSNLTSLDVSGFKTDKVTDMGWMFSGCSNLTSLDVSGFKTDKVTDMRWMFSGCSKLTSLDLSSFNTANVTNMGNMFYNCSNLTSLDVSGFKTDNVTDMLAMFAGCSNLTSLDVSGFKTDKVTDMLAMFAGCSNLTILDVSGFKTDNVTNMRTMFYGCSILTTIYASKSWNMLNVTDSSDMFYGCSKLVGGAGTTFDRSHTNGEYARIDEGKIKPGYFTYKEYSGIETPLSIGAGASGVYNLGGAKVRSAQEGANGLPSGLYIVNKKKILVK